MVVNETRLPGAKWAGTCDIVATVGAWSSNKRLFGLSGYVSCRFEFARHRAENLKFMSRRIFRPALDPAVDCNDSHAGGS